MLAVRTYAAGEPLRLEDVPVPVPRGTEVLIRVAGPASAIPIFTSRARIGCESSAR